MNALAHRAPRVAPRRGKHALPAASRALTHPVVPRPFAVVGAALCCTLGLMSALYVVASTVA